MSALILLISERCNANCWDTTLELAPAALLYSSQEILPLLILSTSCSVCLIGAERSIVRPPRVCNSCVACVAAIERVLRPVALDPSIPVVCSNLACNLSIVAASALISPRACDVVAAKSNLIGVDN